MKKRLVQIGVLSIAAAVGLQLMAKPAKPGLITVRNSDGTELTVRLVGDEYFHQYMTEDGYPLVEKNGSFYYCDYDNEGNLLPSDIRATRVSERPAVAQTYLNGIEKSTLNERIQARAVRSERRKSLELAAVRNASGPQRAGEANDNERPPYDRGYGLFPDLRFPAYGDQKAIVILVEYTDVKFQANYSDAENAYDYFNRMLNEEGFSAYGGTGSAAQYFRENSGNHFRPEFDVFGPITLAHNQAYYGGNDWYGNDQRPEEMVIEACAALDDTVDFKDYDRNNDGVVDNIFIFYAGRGEASGGSSNTVWPHSWNMVSAGYSNLKYDGVRIHTYGCSNEWESGRPDGVGTFVHEFSHVMGLPDLYATSYTSSFTPGSWSALDYGPYNNDGMTPPFYGAFERYALGWLAPREVTGPLNATLQPVEENVCGVIRTAKDTEFFLLENRQQRGWDAYVPGHGMLVWHVDYNESVWSTNKVNNTPSHQYVDIEEADGTQSDYTRSGDSFPGSSNKTSFTSSTNPAMKTWGGTAINFPITEIAETPEGNITFKVLGGGVSSLEGTQALAATDETSEGFTANWVPAEGLDVLLSVYSLDEQGAETYLEGYKDRNMGAATSEQVQGTSPETEYFYYVKTSNGWEQSEPSEPIQAITGRRTIEFYPVVALEATDVTQHSFEAAWEELQDAETYFLTVYTKESGDPFEDLNGFDNGVQDLPKGWNASTQGSYAMASYSGEAVPSLRLSGSDWVSTPEYEDGLNGLSFWCRGNGSADDDHLDVYANTPEGQLLVSSEPVIRDKGGKTVEVTNFPENALSAKIVYVRTSSSGAVAIDDVKALHGHDMVPSVLAEYDAKEVGNVLNHHVEGLNPGTDYYYTLVAGSDQLRSKTSNEVKVRTENGTGVGAVQYAATLRVEGNQVLCNSAAEILVADYTGALVARGSRKVTLPRAGLYIVTVPSLGCKAKVIIK